MFFTVRNYVVVVRGCTNPRKDESSMSRFVITGLQFRTTTSNVATTSTFLPVFGAVAVGIGVLPVSLTVPVCLAASCAFMLPVATPPNAVVFGSGYLKIEDMVKKGIWLNIASIILTTLFVYFLLPLIWNLV